MEVSYKKQRDIVEGEVAERQDRGDMLARGEGSLLIGVRVSVPKAKHF